MGGRIVQVGYFNTGRPWGGVTEFHKSSETGWERTPLALPAMAKGKPLPYLNFGLANSYSSSRREWWRSSELPFTEYLPCPRPSIRSAVPKLRGGPQGCYITFQRIFWKEHSNICWTPCKLPAQGSLVFECSWCHALWSWIYGSFDKKHHAEFIVEQEIRVVIYNLIPRLEQLVEPGKLTHSISTSLRLFKKELNYYFFFQFMRIFQVATKLLGQKHLVVLTFLSTKPKCCFFLLGDRGCREKATETLRVPWTKKVWDLCIMPFTKSCLKQH